ncbi:hypothetical protein FRC12_000527 [Ceratobasidium sp. 428]|nr:hypothetical protein FRC12_000527 [Ceratobasidium sp. 428]
MAIRIDASELAADSSRPLAVLPRDLYFYSRLPQLPAYNHISPQTPMRFEHPITRPYPWRFATTSIIILSAIVLVIISYFSVIAVGMTPAPIITSTTFQEGRLPTLMERVSVHKALKFNPGCERATLMVGRTYQTTNGAFTYTLQSLTNRSTGQTLLSISYGGPPLGDCFIQSTETFANFSADESSFVATVSCTLIGNVGMIATVLSIVALRMDSDSSVGKRWHSVAHLNGTQSPTFATAKLLAAFGGDIINQSLGSPDGKPLPKLYWDYSPQENTTRLESSYPSRLPVGTVSIASDTNRIDLPAETVTVFRNFASVFWSAILSDLGVTSELNILTSSERFRSVIQNVSIPISFHYDGMTGGTGVNAAISNTTAFGLPFVNAQSTSFSVPYLCHRMKWKSGGSLVGNVLATTFSFFMAYWGVLNLGLKYIASSSSPDG